MSSILWLTWKDYRHPQAGGAEVMLNELSRRLTDDGHTVTFLTCGYPNAAARGPLGGVDVIRIGNNRYTHSFQALAYYLRHLRNRFDLLIEEVNGAAPYFSVLFERQARKFLLYYQLGRKNWFYETPPIVGHIGYYVLAPAASRIASASRAPVITISESGRQTLSHHGFHPTRTHVIPVGIETKPVANLTGIKKFTRPTLLSFGAMRAMKRTLDQVKAFELAKQYIPKLRLVIAGSAGGPYGKKVMNYIEQSPYSRSIEYVGKVSDEDKIALMQKSHLTMQTAIEEGWGLTITEAASQGTPAVAYNVDGLRDSIRDGKTGLLTRETPEALSDAIVALLKDKREYTRMRRAAWRWSKQITFDQSYQDFKKILEIA
jgi:glycosyltransferase involved in cell wall biosynthesis